MLQNLLTTWSIIHPSNGLALVRKIDETLPSFGNALLVAFQQGQGRC